MIAFAHSAEPENVKVRVEITLTIGEWKRFLGQISPGGGASSFPAWAISDCIKEAVEKFTDVQYSVKEYSNESR